MKFSIAIAVLIFLCFPYSNSTLYYRNSVLANLLNCQYLLHYKYTQSAYVRFICLMIFMFFSPLSHAQTWFENGKDDNGNPNFFLIQKEAEKYFQSIDITQKGVGYKPYKRWEENWRHRINKDGSFPDAGINQKNFNEYLSSFENRSRSVNTANWANLGPDISQGGYIGLGRVNCMAFNPLNPNIIWVGSPGGGLWKSTNNGLTWSTNYDNIGTLGISSIVIDPTNPDIMYVATGDIDGWSNYSIGVLKSTDGGMTWQTTGLNWTVNQGRGIRKIFMDPNNNNMLMAATSDGLYRTTNGGNTWTKVSSEFFWDLEANPNTATNRFYGSTGNKLFTSVNNGATWTEIQEINDNNRILLAVSPNDANVVYALCSSNSASAFNGLYKSTNAGASYTLVSAAPNILSHSLDGSGAGGQGWYDLCLAVDPTNANIVYAGGIHMWKSTNGGATWAFKSRWVEDNAETIHADQHALEWQNDTTLWVGNDGGVYKTTDGGINWTDRSNGLVISQMFRFDVAQQNSKIITGLQDNGTKVRQTSGIWADRISGDGMDCHINPNNPSIMYASYQIGNFFRSIDGGNSFNYMDVPDQNTGGWITPMAIDPSNPQNVYIAYKRIQKSTNDGATWTSISADISTDNISYLFVAPSNGNILYAGPHYGPLFRSDDGGVNWTTRTSPADGLQELAIHPNNPNIIWSVHSGYSSGVKVFKSINGGSTWTNISGNLPNLPANCIIYQLGSEDGLYIGMDVGVFYKDNTMNDWVLFNQGLPNTRVTDLKIKYNTGELYAATYGRGAWKSPLYSAGGFCANPGVLTVNNVGVNSATVTWNTPSIQPLGFEYAVTTSPTPPSAGTFTTQTNIELSNLLSNTTYFLHVRSVCEAGAVSIWSISFPFITKTTCNDLSTDTGGPTEKYSNFENTVRYICPDAPNKKTVITFTQFDVEGNYDALYIFDGPSINSPLFSSGNPPTLANFPAGGYHGNTLPGTFTSTHPTGCLTLQLRTDYVEPRDGWAAEVTCIDITPCNLALDLALSNESCYLCNDGSAVVNISGGSGQYTYLWSNGSTSLNPGPLAPGLHYVQVTDDNLCNISDSITIAPYICPGFAILPNVEDVLCFGECNGVVNLALSNGSQSFQVVWADGNTKTSRADLCKGTYTITITDADKCVATDSVEVYQPELFSVNGITINHSINGEDGSITINYIGAQGQITWFLNGVEYDSDDSLSLNQVVFSDLAPQCYLITGKDENACTLVTDSLCVDNISAVDDLKRHKIFLFPNPATDIIHVSNASSLSDFSIEITNVSGTILHKSANQRMVNISTLNSGIYFVTLTTPQRVYFKKLIKI